jgi:hypothetical protein
MESGDGWKLFSATWSLFRLAWKLSPIEMEALLPPLLGGNFREEHDMVQKSNNSMNRARSFNSLTFELFLRDYTVDAFSSFEVTAGTGSTQRNFGKLDVNIT